MVILAILINKVLAEHESEGIETEYIQIGVKNLRGCIGCMKCFEKKDKKYVISNDIFNDCLMKMLYADGIILGLPTYTVNISSDLKAFIDRADLVGLANNQLFKRKVGAVPAFDAINHLLSNSPDIYYQFNLLEFWNRFWSR